MVHRPVIRADLAENDNTLKHNDRPGESKREEEMREKEPEQKERYAKHTRTHTHTHTHTHLVQPDSVV